MKKIIVVLLFLMPGLLFADTKIFDEQDLLRAHKLGSAPSKVTLEFRSEEDEKLKNCFLVDIDSGNKLVASHVQTETRKARFESVPEGFWRISALPEGKHILVKIDVK